MDIIPLEVSRIDEIKVYMIQIMIYITWFFAKPLYTPITLH